VKNILAVLFLMLSINAIADQKVIAVIGKSEFEYDAELINIHFSIANQTKTNTKEAKDEVDNISSKIARALLKIGVKEDDIISSAFRVDSNRPYRNNCPQDPVPVVERNIELRLKDIKLYRKAVDTIINNGATSIRHIQSELIDKKKYEKKAMIAAIKDAKEQAKFLVEGFGAKIGDVHRIGERTTQHNPRIQEAFARSAAKDTSGDVKPYEFKPTPVMINAQVHVEFEIN